MEGGADVELEGLTFHDGSVDEDGGWDGGAILISSSQATITGCTFAENVAFSAGGAIDIRDASEAIVTTCEFTENTASGWVSTDCAAAQG